jgi:hypothetical protein
MVGFGLPAGSSSPDFASGRLPPHKADRLPLAGPALASLSIAADNFDDLPCLFVIFPPAARLVLFGNFNDLRHERQALAVPNFSCNLPTSHGRENQRCGLESCVPVSVRDRRTQGRGRSI